MWRRAQTCFGASRSQTGETGRCTHLMGKSGFAQGEIARRTAKESNQDVTDKKAWLADRGIHSIGRYGSWTYCSIEDNMLEARALAEKLG